uniref:Uncharacterized protein n=1 Tax=Plectus sambesii TaxID=2011161 RepID=A0A914X5B5_9BILA
MIGKCSIAFAVAVAVLIDVPFASAQATCQNPGQMGPCMQAFFANLGFAGQNNGFPYNNTVFVSTLHDYVMQNDIAGWNNLQKWMNTLISCAGGQSAFEACGDWHILMTQFHLSQQEAMEYESQFRVLEYETGPAFPVITHNWFCMKQVDQTEGQVVQMCRQHFDDEQHQNPNMTC